MKEPAMPSEVSRRGGDLLEPGVLWRGSRWIAKGTAIHHQQMRHPTVFQLETEERNLVAIPFHEAAAQRGSAMKSRGQGEIVRGLVLPQPSPQGLNVLGLQIQTIQPRVDKVCHGFTVLGKRAVRGGGDEQGSNQQEQTDTGCDGGRHPGGSTPPWKRADDFPMSQQCRSEFRGRRGNLLQCGGHACVPCLGFCKPARQIGILLRQLEGFLEPWIAGILAIRAIRTEDQPGFFDVHGCGGVGR
jgi:hypothetical protein